MIDYARTVDPLEEALARLDAMLAGLAADHDEYRSREELLGGVTAVRDRLYEAYEYATVRARGWQQPLRTVHSTLSRRGWDLGSPRRAERETVAAAV